MKLISHRGNLHSRDINTENCPKQIKSVLNLGLDCEIDVWYKDNNFFLGHDKPEFNVSIHFLRDKRLWCHAKNIEALILMRKDKNIHYFWHENDEITLTSKGVIWAFPRKIAINNSVVVLPEMYRTNTDRAFGICSDEITKYIK